MKNNTKTMPCGVGKIDLIFSTSSIRPIRSCRVFSYCEINKIKESPLGTT